MTATRVGDGRFDGEVGGDDVPFGEEEVELVNVAGHDLEIGPALVQIHLAGLGLV
jgi:hypothetical protein